MILIKNIEVFAPENLGIKDVLIVNDKIALIEENIDTRDDMKIIDGEGRKLIPGLIDNHVHITGGGGEGSFKTQVPEIQLSKLIEGGITTVVGLLGTDGITRSVENLLAKTKSLKEEGITAYAHTGAYGYPSPTLTGSVKKDIIFIDEILGVKIALSDHRAPSISKDELARLASDARVAGMLSGKPGMVVAHMGDSKVGLGLINQVLEETEIPITTIRPTHVNRRRELLDEAYDYAKCGGFIDLTCGLFEDLRPSRCIKEAMKKDIPQENILVSSDGYGSWSNYNDSGKLLEIGASSVKSLYKELRVMVLEEDFKLEDALIFFTSNIANSLKIDDRKGSIKIGMDGDLLVLDEELNLDYVIANGQIMMEEGNILVKGTYE